MAGNAWTLLRAMSFGDESKHVFGSNQGLIPAARAIEGAGPAAFRAEHHIRKRQSSICNVCSNIELPE